VRGNCPRLTVFVRREVGVLWPRGFDHDALELLDPLQRAALEYLEVSLREVADRHVVFRRIDVDPDVVRLGEKRRRPWLRRILGVEGYDREERKKRLQSSR